MTKSMPSLRDFAMPDAGRDLCQLEAMIFAYARAHDPAVKRARDAMEKADEFFEIVSSDPYYSDWRIELTEKIRAALAELREVRNGNG